MGVAAARVEVEPGNARAHSGHVSADYRVVLCHLDDTLRFLSMIRHFALPRLTVAERRNPPAAFIAAEIVRVVMDFVLRRRSHIAPVSAIALVLCYYDQRVRKEGFDIEWMMQQAGLAQPLSATPPIEIAGMPPIEGVGISGPIGPPDTVEEP